MSTPTQPLPRLTASPSCAATGRLTKCEHFTWVNPSDLTAVELLAMLTVPRPARDRIEAEKPPPPVLELVRGGKRRR